MDSLPAVLPPAEAAPAGRFCTEIAATVDREAGVVEESTRVVVFIEVTIDSEPAWSEDVWFGDNEAAGVVAAEPI